MCSANPKSGPGDSDPGQAGDHGLLAPTLATSQPPGTAMTSEPAANAPAAPRSPFAEVMVALVAGKQRVSTEKNVTSRKTTAQERKRETTHDPILTGGRGDSYGMSKMGEVESEEEIRKEMEELGVSNDATGSPDVLMSGPMIQVTVIVRRPPSPARSSSSSSRGGSIPPIDPRLRQNPRAEQATEGWQSG